MSLFLRFSVVLLACACSATSCATIALAREGSLDDNGGVTFFYGGLPLRIPPGVGSGGAGDDSTRAVIEVVMPVGTIEDIEVQIDALAHTFDTDLDIYLQSPTGTRVLLSSDNGGSGNDYLACRFRDGAAVSIQTGVAPFTGDYQPEQPLSTFDNENPNGPWTLIIDDDAPSDVGQISGWSIQILLAVPPPCPGLYTLSHTEYEFTPTYVGNVINTADIVVGNFSDSPVCITNITSTGGVWNVFPNSMFLNPGDAQTLNVSFAPTFSHEFQGVIEIFTDHPAQRRDSIRVSGRACQPVQSPPPPWLAYTDEEHFIHYAMPWDANDIFTDYAIEYSRDGFVNSRFVSLDSISSNQVEWHNVIVWGKEGTGAIGLLQAGTNYDVRLHARDCTGTFLIGLSATMATAGESMVDSSQYHLTVMTVQPDSVELNWTPVANDQFGNILPTHSFEVLAGPTPGSVLQTVGYSDDGSFALRRDPALQKYFRVEPVLTGTKDICTPVITWPPQGAWVYGFDEMVLQDFVHAANWDSFRIEIDSAGFPALIASSFDATSTGGYVSVWVNYDHYGPGPHTITAQVLDHHLISWSTSVNISIAAHPSASFDAVYDPALHRFSANAIDYSGLTGNLVDTWWMCSLAGERTNSVIDFEYKPGEDSVSLLLPFPQTDFKLWTGELEWPSNSDPFIGVKVPAVGEPPGTVKLPPESLGVCCIDLQVLVSGRTHSNSRDRGAVVECKKESDAIGEYEVGFVWEIEITWEVRKGQYNYSFGWDEKSTLIETAVICTVAAGEYDYRVPLDKKGKPVASDTVHHKHGTPKFPASGPTMGKSERDPKTARVNKPDKPEVGNRIVTYRNKTSKYLDKKMLPEENGVWVRGDYWFYARAKDDCSGAECCRDWAVDWDVVFCENCHKIINSAPELVDLGGGPCSDLVP